MTPQTAAALRALVTKWRDNCIPFPNHISYDAGHSDTSKRCADELAAVLTQEGAEKCRQCGGTGQVDDTDCNTWPCPWCKAAPAEPRAESEFDQFVAEFKDANPEAMQRAREWLREYKAKVEEPRAAEGAGTESLREFVEILLIDLSNGGGVNFKADTPAHAMLTELCTHFLSTAPALPCGHHASLAINSAEDGRFLYCDLCDAKSGRRDAEHMERELRATAAAAVPAGGDAVAWLLEMPEHKFQKYQKRLYFNAGEAEKFGSFAEYPELSTVTPLGRIGIGTYACPLCGKDTPHTHAAPAPTDGSSVMMPLEEIEWALRQLRENGDNAAPAVADALACFLYYRCGPDIQRKHIEICERWKVDPMAADRFAAVLAEARRVAPFGQGGESSGYIAGWNAVLEFIARAYEDKSYPLRTPAVQAQDAEQKRAWQEFKRQWDDVPEALKSLVPWPLTDSLQTLGRAMETQPAGDAQDAGPMARHWKQAVNEWAHRYLPAPFSATQPLDWIEQRARELAVKEAK